MFVSSRLESAFILREGTLIIHVTTLAAALLNYSSSWVSYSYNELLDNIEIHTHIVAT